MKEILTECGYRLSVEKAHATEYVYGGIVIYTIPAKQLNVVVSPDDYEFVSNMECKKYHNTALTAYPKELNKGKSEIHYGYQIKFDNESEMKNFLNKYKSREHRNL
jgi:hypothetical protein